MAEDDVGGWERSCLAGEGILRCIRLRWERSREQQHGTRIAQKSPSNPTKIGRLPCTRPSRAITEENSECSVRSLCKAKISCRDSSKELRMGGWFESGAAPVVGGAFLLEGPHLCARIKPDILILGSAVKRQEPNDIKILIRKTASVACFLWFL